MAIKFHVKILHVLIFSVLFSVTVYIPQAYFLPNAPFQPNILSSKWVAASYIPLTCWILLITLWIRFWKKKCGYIFPRPSTLSIIFFTVIYIVCNYTFYNFQVVATQGDAIANMALSMSMGSGRSPYIPWTTACGYGRQTLFYVIYVPYFMLKGPDAQIPLKILLFSNFVSIFCFYVFLKTIKIDRVTGYLLFTALMIKPCLVIWQGLHYPQQLTPAFEFLNLLFFYKAILARKDSPDLELLFWTVLLGVSVGVGFNIYDVNYLFGSAMVSLYLFSMVLLYFTRKDQSVLSLLSVVSLFLVSIAFGAGPLLGYFIRYPRILRSRLRTGTIETKSLADFIKYLKFFWELHWDQRWTHYWISKLALILVVPGMIISFFKKPRLFWFAFWMVLLMLFMLFICSGRFGKRRIISIIFFEYIFIAITLNYFHLKLKQWGKLPGIAAPVILIIIFGGSIVINAKAGIKLIRLNEVTRSKQRDKLAIDQYGKFLLQFSKYRNLIVIEPRSSHTSIFWTGGRPEIYELMETDFRFYRTGKTFKMLPKKLEHLARNNEPFVFVFFLKDDLKTSLTSLPPKLVPRNFGAVTKLEKLFHELLQKHGVKNVKKKILNHENKLVVHAYIKE